MLFTVYAACKCKHDSRQRHDLRHSGPSDTQEEVYEPKITARSEQGTGDELTAMEKSVWEMKDEQRTRDARLYGSTPDFGAHIGNRWCYWRGDPGFPFFVAVNGQCVARINRALRCGSYWDVWRNVYDHARLFIVGV